MKMSQIKKRKGVNVIHLSRSHLLNINKPSIEKGLFKMSKSKNETESTNEAVVNELNSTIDQLELVESHLITLIDSLIEENSALKLNSKDGRKSQVLDILINQGPVSIIKIAEQLNISTKNVSSQLTYLRSDNVKICTDHRGFKFIIE